MVCAVNIINLKGEPTTLSDFRGPCSAATLPALKLHVDLPPTWTYIGLPCMNPTWAYIGLPCMNPTWTYIGLPCMNPTWTYIGLPYMNLHRLTCTYLSSENDLCLLSTCIPFKLHVHVHGHVRSALLCCEYN